MINDKMEKVLNNVIREARIQLLETIRDYEIDPSHKAWFILSDGRILGGFTHRSIIKNNFEKDWKVVKDSNEEEWIIIETFEKRLMMTGSIRIGEFDNNFYVILLHLDSIEKDMIQGFVESLIKRTEYDTLSSKMHISNTSGVSIAVLSLEDISEGKLHTL
jgi:hypothetical protein